MRLLDDRYLQLRLQLLVQRSQLVDLLLLRLRVLLLLRKLALQDLEPPLDVHDHVIPHVDFLLVQLQLRVDLLQNRRVLPLRLQTRLPEKRLLEVVATLLVRALQRLVS